MPPKWAKKAGAARLKEQQEAKKSPKTDEKAAPVDPVKVLAGPTLKASKSAKSDSEGSEEDSEVQKPKPKGKEKAAPVKVPVIAEAPKELEPQKEKPKAIPQTFRRPVPKKEKSESEEEEAEQPKVEKERPKAIPQTFRKPVPKKNKNHSDEEEELVDEKGKAAAPKEKPKPISQTFRKPVTKKESDDDEEEPPLIKKEMPAKKVAEPKEADKEQKQAKGSKKDKKEEKQKDNRKEKGKVKEKSAEKNAGETAEKVEEEDSPKKKQEPAKKKEKEKAAEIPGKKKSPKAPSSEEEDEEEESGEEEPKRSGQRPESLPVVSAERRVALEAKFNRSVPPIRTRGLAKVLPYMYLGDAAAAAAKDELLAQEIDHIINCASEDVENFFPETFSYSSFPLDDESEPKEFFDEFFEIMSQAKEDKMKVLVHCTNGKNAAPAMIMSYILKAAHGQEKITSLQATFKFLTSKEPGVNPTDNYLADLIDLEVELFEEASMRVNRVGKAGKKPAAARGRGRGGSAGKGKRGK